MKQTHEVIVAGSGPVGIGVARRLAERGLQVTVLEAGAAITEPPGSHIRNQQRSQQDPDSYFGAIERYLSAVTDPAKPSLMPGVTATRWWAARESCGLTTVRERRSSNAGRS